MFAQDKPELTENLISDMVNQAVERHKQANNFQSFG